MRPMSFALVFGTVLLELVRKAEQEVESACERRISGRSSRSG